MVTVQFPLLNTEVEVEENSLLSDACAQAGYPLNLVCGGKGKCKKCGVDIEENGVKKNVLSCQTKVYDGMQVMLKEEEQKAQILTSAVLDEINMAPAVYTVKIEADSLSTPLGANDWDILKTLINKDIEKPSLTVFQKLSFQYHNPQGIKLVLWKNTIIDVLPGDDEEAIYGIAFDLGTTSAVGYLYNLEEMKLVGIESTTNKQTEMGGDVISRIDYVIRDNKNLDRLQKLGTKTLNEITEDLCKEHKIDEKHIYATVVGGNSTMQHLLLGIYPEHLGKAPFTSTVQDKIETSLKDIGLKGNPEGKLTFLHLLGGFVGADTTAVLVALPKDNKPRLMLDLGTNGEIAVGKNTRYKVSSTAGGPALEGAGLSSGMRGTHGAIERVSIEDGKLNYSVIGNVKPEGICGSGVIDLVSVLFNHKILNKRGAFVDPSKVTDEDLKKRLVVKDGVKSFILEFADQSANGKDIYFTQDDVRQVQLAKGAIYTGCVMVTDHYGIKGEDLEEIVIAGAFGNYIDVEHAQSIGMIPNFEGVPVRSLGNAAGTGAQMYLLSKEKQEECDRIGEEAIFVELADDPNFRSQYMKNTYFSNLLPTKEDQ
ncbi:MAG TPA: activating enzyme [Eubacteriaceae bacterium]|nr:activating enzyme [Eubacteriaceae bacterium]